jgi:FAD/FMN-containing dehydrogenase
MTATLNLPDAAIENLRSTLRGELLQPGQDGYDDARRVWNAMIDQRPALVARCRGAADVIAAVNFAREHGVLVSVRGGGHSAAGKAVAGGLIIDQSHMKSIRVDPQAMTVRAESGVLWGELDRETAVSGLATPGGTVATTGIAGLTLGGGQGWLNGKYGFVVDNLLAADVVTADGRLLHASARENEDLFWGLRGAGANLGVVTSFEYRLHPVSTVLGGMAIHPFERAAEVLRFYREFSTSQPDELTTWVAILTAPDGNLVIAMVTCYSGPVEEGEQAVEPLRRFGPPVTDTIAPISYVAMQQILTEAFPPGRLN